MIEITEIVNIANITINETTESVNIDIVENINIINIEVSEMGMQGLNGKSNYQVAVENGYIGTELQWLDSQKNVDGGLIY